MTMERNYFVLGVGESASPAELKAAFRRLARRYHPDISREKNAKEKFIEIVNAYRALTAKRNNADEQSKPAENHTSAQPEKNKDCHIDAYVSVEELYWGTELKVNPSALCLGRRSEKNWHNANLLKVKMPRGTRNGERLRVRGNIYITVRLKSHEHYEVSGNNLYVDMPLSRFEAQQGAIVDVITPGGRVEVDVPAGIASGQSIRIPHRGLPSAFSEAGDLFAVARLMNVTARSQKLHKWPHTPHADALRWRTVGSKRGNTIDVRI